jgi:hypothetical protein
MWLYEKKLQYPVRVCKKDLPMAKFLLTQFGGPNGELSAAVRYLSQRYSMPDDLLKALGACSFSQRLSKRDPAQALDLLQFLFRFPVHCNPGPLLTAQEIPKIQTDNNDKNDLDNPDHTTKSCQIGI